MTRSLPVVPARSPRLSHISPQPVRRRATRSGWPAPTPLALAAALCVLAATPGAQATGYTWNTGDFAPGVTAPSPLLLGDSLTIGSGAGKRFNGVAFVNQGTVAWTTDAIGGGGSATIANAGLWDIQADSPSFQWGFGGQPVFTNTGTFSKSAGALTSLGNYRFVNDAGGLISVSSGVLSFNGGNPEFNDGSRFSGAGSTQIDAAATFSGGLKSDNLVLANGSFNGVSANFNGGVAGAGLLRWTGGDFTGTWNVAGGRNLVALDGAGKRLNATNFTNAGTLSWQSTQPLQGFNSAGLRIKGTLDLQASATTQWLAGGRPKLTLSDTSLVKTRAGVSFASGNFNWTADGGQFDAEAGGSLVFNGGSARFNSGTRFTGAGSHLFTADATFIGDISSANVTLASGTFKGGKNATTKANLSGTVTWTGGDLSGNWQLSNNQTLSGQAGGSKRMAGAVFVNRGKLLWNTVESLQGFNAANLSNEGRFEVSLTSGLQWIAGSQPTLTNTALGTVRALAGATLFGGNWAHVSDGGLYDAATGSAIVFNGTDNTFRDGTRFTGLGVNRVTGNARMVGTVTSANLAFASGNLIGGDGVTPGSRGTLAGTLSWTGGDLGGAWTLPVGHVLTATAGGSKRLAGTDLINEGSMFWQTIEGLQGFSSAVFSNRGLFEAQQSSTWSWIAGGQPSVVNTATGTVRASGGATLSLGNLALTSEGGLFDAKVGSSIQFGGSVTMKDNTRYTGAGSVAAVGSARFVGRQKSDNLVLAGGTLTGGDGTPGSVANLRGTTSWTGGDLAGAWQVDSGQTLKAATGGGKRLNGTSFVNAGTLRWDMAEPLQMFNSASLVNDGVVLMQADASLSWLAGGQPSVVNNGQWRKTAGTGTSSMSVIQLSNNGILQVDVGTIALPNPFSNGGTLSGAGSFSTGTLINNGLVSPGNFQAALGVQASPFSGRHARMEASTTTATLSIAGNYQQSPGGALDIQLTNASTTDLLLVSGNASVGGALNVGCLGTCSFSTGQTVTVLDAAGSLSGTFATVNLVGFPPGAFSVSYDTANARVQLTATGPIAVVGGAARR